MYAYFFLTIQRKYGTLIAVTVLYGGIRMVALIVGLLFIAFPVFAALPSGLGWAAHIVLFLKGFLPFFTAFTGLIALFIGIADIKDKNEAKKEEAASKLQEDKAGR